ncbi:MAG: RES family NAD+ phosphorylase [Rhodospirillaceae bacterium]|nr:RES family NAD+ phosphorylase [Rhodospirillaceae bacterium]
MVESVRRIRDQRLLDALEQCERAPYAGRVWRSVREGRDPLACWRAGGRWDDGTLDVLYTSETKTAAGAERRFHLYQGQPLPPSKVRYRLFELRVSLRAVVRFPGLEALASIGFDVGSFGQLSYVEREREYPRSQEIAEACAFLGADGLLVPSARETSSNNLIVFCEQEGPADMAVVANHGYVAFD